MKVTGSITIRKSVPRFIAAQSHLATPSHAAGKPQRLLNKLRLVNLGKIGFRAGSFLKGLPAKIFTSTTITAHRVASLPWQLPTVALSLGLLFAGGSVAKSTKGRESTDSPLNNMAPGLVICMTRRKDEEQLKAGNQHPEIEGSIKYLEKISRALARTLPAGEVSADVRQMLQDENPAFQLFGFYLAFSGIDNTENCPVDALLPLTRHSDDGVRAIMVALLAISRHKKHLPTLREIYRQEGNSTLIGAMAGSAIIFLNGLDNQDARKIAISQLQERNENLHEMIKIPLFQLLHKDALEILKLMNLN